MRVLVSSVPGYGHLHPLLPLAIALRDAGHHVAIATGPDLRARAQRFGFEAFSVGLTIAEGFQRLAQRFPDAEYNRLTPDEILDWYVPHLFGEVLAPATLPDLESLLRMWRADVLVHDTWELAAPIAAAAAGIPSVSQTLGLRFSPSLLQAAAKALAPLWSARGLAPDASAGLYRELCLDTTPPGLQVDAAPPKVAPLRPESPPLLSDEHAPAWVHSRDTARPLVYMTLGTNTNSDQAMFRAVIEGVTELGLDLLVTTGPGSRRDALGALPANVHVEPYVAQALVLPECSAVVCHAGAGTTLASLAHAIPLVLVPQGADQYIVAQRVARAGAGVCLAPALVTPRSIRQALECVLSARTIRRAAAGLSEEIAAMPSASSAVELIVSAQRSSTTSSIGFAQHTSTLPSAAASSGSGA